jgi:hypothetical protein
MRYFENDLYSQKVGGKMNGKYMKNGKSQREFYRG